MSDLLKVRVGGSSYLCKWEIPSGLIYETDFSNLDLDTGIDIPLRGSPKKWNFDKANVTKITKEIGGITYKGLHLSPGSSLILDESLTNSFDKHSLEFTTNKDNWEGLGCGCTVGGYSVPFYNCYTSSRGIAISANQSGVATLNDFFYNGDGGWTSNRINRDNVTQLVTGGVYRDITQNKDYVYLCGLKALIRPRFSSTTVRIYTDGGRYPTNMNIFNFKIYKKNRFEEME